MMRHPMMMVAAMVAATGSAGGPNLDARMPHHAMPSDHVAASPEPRGSGRGSSAQQLVALARKNARRRRR